MAANASQRPLRRALVVALTLWPVLSGGAAGAEMVGRWKLLSGQTSAGKGYCTMELDEGGKGVGVQVVKDGADVMLLRDATASASKPPLATRVTVDGAPAFSGSAIAVQPGVFVLFLPTGSRAIDALAGGRTLQATVADRSLTLDLSGAAAARDAVRACLAKK